MDKLRVQILFGLFLGLAFCVPTAHATEPSVHIVGPVGQIQSGTIFPVEIRIDTGGININAAEITVQVIGEGTEIVRLARESSIFTLWPQVPSINGATASFVGGRPGGVVAVDALVGTVFVVARQAGPVNIVLQRTNSGLYRHDGAGTKVFLTDTSAEFQVADDLLPNLVLTSTTHPDETDWGRAGEIDVAWKVMPGEQYSYRFSNDISIVPDDDIDAATPPLRFSGLDDGIWYFVIKHRTAGETWSPIYQRRFQLDRTPPAKFTIEYLQPTSVGGHQLITWQAVDAVSSEVLSTLRIGKQQLGVVTSPLDIDPTWVGKEVEITLTDAAGNKQTASWIVPGQASSFLQWWVMIIVGAVVVVITTILSLRFVRRRR